MVGFIIVSCVAGIIVLVARMYFRRQDQKYKRDYLSLQCPDLHDPLYCDEDGYSQRSREADEEDYK